MNDKSLGFLSEVFISIQGEGSWVGKRQLFIRLAGCSQQCPYCDTKNTWKKKVKNWVMYDSNKWPPISYENPVLLPFLLPRVKQIMRKHAVYSVAITGGEPLEQPEFMLGLLNGLKRNIDNLEIMLETNGLEHKVIKKLKGKFDFLAMDIKLPSVAKIAGSMKKHAAFFRATEKIKKGCVKVVFGPQTPLPEIAAAALLAKRHQPSWDFILQPRSGPNWSSAKNKSVLENNIGSIAKIHSQLRLIPQMHKYLYIK